MGNSESDNKGDRPEGYTGLRATLGIMEMRNTTGRLTFRESLKQGKEGVKLDPDIGTNILN